MNQILEKTGAKVILHPKAIEHLKKGQHSFEGGCSSRLAWSVFQIMKVVGKGEHRYPPVDARDRFWVVNAKNRVAIEKTLGARVVELPGHTQDSIGLLFEKEVFFSGDAVMNGFPSRHHISIWIENLTDYKRSWEKMMTLDFKKVYPSHGKAFAKEKMLKAMKYLTKIKLYPLR